MFLVLHLAQQINVTGDLNLAFDNGTIRRNSKLLFSAGAGNPTYYAGIGTVLEVIIYLELFQVDLVTRDSA